MIAAVTHVSAAWAATRATGVVSLILLTVSVLLGIIAAAGLKTRGWPRFASQDLHRNVSLICVALIAIHVATTVADGYVPIGYLDAIVPFRSSYRTVYVGLGAVALDLFLAVIVTSALRRRIGFAAWRAVHWAAYLSWPLAVVHALGTGTDTRMRLVTGVEVACVIPVLLTSLWWLVVRRDLTPGKRALGSTSAVLAVLAISVFALLGPLQSGWAKRAVGPARPASHTPAASLGPSLSSTSLPSTASPPSIVSLPSGASGRVA